MSKKQLISGGSGFIGSHLLDSLVEQGESVINLDIKPPRSDAKQHRFIQCDIAENTVFKLDRIDTVYHLAA